MQTAVFPSTLASSKLFQGGVVLHDALHRALVQTWQSSLLGRFCINAFARHVQEGEASSWALGILPSVMSLALLIGCTFLDTSVLGIGVLGIGAWVLLASLLTGKNAWVKSPQLLDVLVLVFFMTYFISACFSSVQPEALMGLAKQSLFLVAFWGLRSTWCHAPQWMQGGFALLLILGVIQSVLGWMQVHGYAGELAGWTDANTPNELKLNRVYGSLKPYNPNLLAAFLVASSGAGLWCLLQLACQPFRFIFPWLGLAGALLAVVSYGIVMTGCRGAYLGLFAEVVSLFILLYPLLLSDAVLKTKPRLQAVWWGLSILGVLGVVGGIFSNEKILHRVQSIFAFRSDSSISYRFNVYKSSWLMFLDNWLVGIGPSNTVFKKIYGFYMTPGFNALGTYSVPLEIMVEQGILGLTSFLSIVGNVWHQLIGGVFDEMRPLAQKLGILTLFVSLLGFMTHGFFDTILYRPPIMIPFLFILSGFITFTSIRGTK